MSVEELLTKIGTGAAAEGAFRYFGDRLRRDVARAEKEIEAAYVGGDTRLLLRAVADWMAAGRQLEEFERDMKAGKAAEKELADG